jgi:predicted CXXCH cytochrome family protein
MNQRVLLFVVLLTILSVTSVVNAEPQKNLGPEFINLKNGPVPLPFTHRKHQLLQDSDCSQCHRPNSWKVDNWGKEVAHAMCISCHDLNDKGPVKCADCHKK